ncbi:MAG TPA: hypothetical protein VE912_13990 [Bacteroidales bacterium]|nr:hypothetical protein [Bacteroidales bacterium]
MGVAIAITYLPEICNPWQIKILQLTKLHVIRQGFCKVYYEKPTFLTIETILSNLFFLNPSYYEKHLPDNNPAGFA